MKLSNWLTEHVTDDPRALRWFDAPDAEDRIVRCYKELLSGYEVDPSTILKTTRVVGANESPGQVEAYARRFQIQEDLVRDIAQEMMGSGHARGVLVKSEAQHLCMVSRGPQSPASVTHAEFALGCLSDQSA